MRYYIVDYNGDVVAEFASYTAAWIYLQKCDKRYIMEMELEIKRDENLGG